jgi:4-nitrophenyl phosphatase
MDGVIWRDNAPIGDLPAVFRGILKRYQVALATNNSTNSVQMYVDKLAGFGVQIEPWRIVNSSQATCAYLKDRFPQGGKVYIVGEKGLHQELAEHGFYPAEQDVLAVVAGMDREINYTKLNIAARLIRQGAVFIGTNPDNTYPTPQGLAPGAGSILAAIEAASGVAPLVMGKPAPEMYRMALQRLEIKPEQALVVGDRLSTDIAGAQNLGCRTALVLSGVTRREEAEAWQPALDYLADDLTHLLELI